MSENPSTDLSANDRNEMLRAFNGLVTAKVAGDSTAVTAQLQHILTDQIAASNGDPRVFGARMAKQVEAGAELTHAVLKSLAPRLGMTVAELQQVYAETAALNDIIED